MEEWEGDVGATRSQKHEPVAYLASASLSSLIYFGAAMGAPLPLHPLPWRQLGCRPAAAGVAAGRTAGSWYQLSCAGGAGRVTTAA